MEQTFFDNDLNFGGQNQIVNQQEQNREVNPGGLTQTDSEKTLYGPPEEAKPEVPVKPLVTSEEKEIELDNEETEIEAPAKRETDTLA